MQNLEKKLRAVEYLRYLKTKHTYRELSEIFGLPITVLNRYISGKILPGNKKTEIFLRAYNEEFNLEEEIKQSIIFDGEYFDNTKILYDTFLLRRIAEYSKTLFDNVDKIFTSATDGLIWFMQNRKKR